MAFCIINSCCGFFDLKTGCIAIGYLKLIIDTAFFIMDVKGLINIGVMFASGMNDFFEFVVMVLAIAFLMVLTVIASIVFTVFLLIGIHKNKRSFIHVYLIVSVILLALSISFALFETISKFNTMELNTTQCVLRTIYYPLSIYFLVVINSYYQSTDCEQPPPYETLRV